MAMWETCMQFQIVMASCQYLNEASGYKICRKRVELADLPSKVESVVYICGRRCNLSLRLAK